MNVHATRPLVFRRHVGLAAIVISALILSRSSNAATLLVDDNAVECPTRTHASIQLAVNAAAPGDTVDVCPGTYAPFLIPSPKTPITIRSTSGPASTLIRGFANGCYGILIGTAGNTSGVTIDGFDIATLATDSNGCDWAAIATRFGMRHDNLALRNNVVHDILAPGSFSCSSSYGIFGFGLNNVHDAIVEDNVFHDITNVGCIPGGIAPRRINSFSSAVQVIFASGADSGYGVDSIVIQNNTIDSARGFNALGVRVKRSQNFAILDNELDGLAGADGTTAAPSATRSFHPQGQGPAVLPGPMIATVRGDVMGNTMAGDLGVVFETTDQTVVTGNDLSGVTTWHAVFSSSDNNFVCDNVLNPAAGFTVADGPNPASTGNTFPGGSGFIGNFYCARSIRIDLRPNNTQNQVNTRAKQLVPLAILGEVDFDPCDEVDIASVVVHGATPSLTYFRCEDVDGDGILDRILYFRARDFDTPTAEECGDPDAIVTLEGSLFSGEPIEGDDDVTWNGPDCP